MAHAAASQRLHQLISAQPGWLLALAIHCASLCLTCPTEAQSSEARVRVVLGDPTLREEVARELRGRGVSIVELPPPVSEPEPSRVRLDDARRAFEQLEPARALAEVEAWLDDVDRGVQPVRRADLLEAFLLRAQVQIALRSSEAALLSIRRARAIDPMLELDPVRHRPSLIALWGQNPPPEPIEVRFEGPAGLHVEVDGAAVETPTELVPGSHVVSFRAPGHEPERGRIDVGPVVHASLEADPMASLAAARNITDEVRTAAARLGATPIIVRREGSRVMARDGGDLGRASVAVGEGAAARLVAALFVVPEELPPPPPPPAPRRWRWVLVGVAGAVLIAGAASAAVLVRRDDGWEARFTP